MIRISVFVAAFLVALFAADPAAAGPVGAIIAAIPTFAASSVIAGFVVRIGISLALSALATAIGRKRPGEARKPGIKTDATTTGGANAQSFILGKYAAAGNMVAPPYSHPNSGNVPNEFLTYVIDLADMPGVQFSRVMVAGEYVTDLQPSDGVHDLEGMIETIPGRGFDLPHLFLTWHDGTQTAADAWMMENYADHPDRPWSADMIGTGVTYAVVAFRYNREMFNQLPGVRFEVLGIPLYDPRRDSTAGGTGAHRWNDPATWEHSANPVLMVYNILRGLTLPDGRRYGGKVPADDLPLDNWFAAMNECDLSVVAGNSSEPQYTAGLEVFLDEPPADVIDDLLAACSAEIAEFGGVYTVRVGPPSLPVYFITDDDIVADQAQSLAPYPGLDGVHNAIHATYPDPESLWESRDAPPRYNAEWEAEDGGRQLVAQVDLPAVYSPTQVQRLMQAWIEDERRFRRHGLTLPPDAAILSPLETLAWSSVGEGYTAKIFEIGELTDDLETCLQTVSIRERDHGDFVWNPETDEITIYHPSKAVTRPAGRVLLGFEMEPHAVTDGTGADRRPALRLIWPITDLAPTDRLEYEVELSDGTPVAAGFVSFPLRGAEIVSAGILPEESYRGRARIVARGPGLWSAWDYATTDDLRFSVDDLTPAVWAAIAQDAQTVASALDDSLVTEHVTPLATELTEATEAIGSLQVEATELTEITADLGRRLDLQDVDQISTAEALGVINDRILWAITRISGQESLVRDAGVYVSPEDGVVRISGVESAEKRASEAEIRLDAAEAQISLRATMADVNTAIADYVLDPSQLPILDDFEATINEVRVDLDAAEAQLILKADQTQITGLDARLSQAEIDLDAAEAQLALKVEQSEFSPLESRVSTAEVQLGALDGPSITATVADTRSLFDGASDDRARDLATLLSVYEEREATRRDLAYATENVNALVTEDREAVAAIKQELGAAIDESAALIRAEKKARATETEALAEDIMDLQADVADAGAALSEINQVSASSGSPNARALHQLQLDVSAAENGIAGNASGLAGLTTRVTAAEGDITSISQDVTQLEADLGLAENGIAGNASGLSQLTTRVTAAEGDITSISQDVTRLEADLNVAEGNISGNASGLSQLTTRVTAAEGDITSISQDVTQLEADLGTAEGDIAGTAQGLASLTTRVTGAEGAISSQASAITNLQTETGDNATSITQAINSIDGIEAEYALRIDNNGVVSGMVVRSELNNNSVPTTGVAFVADKFSISGPSGTDRQTPFAVYTTAQVIDGETIPPGVYIEKAYIRKGLIGTLELAQGAAHAGARFYGPAVLVVSSDANWNAMATLRIDRAGFATDLTFSAAFDGYGSGVAELGLFRNGVLVQLAHQATAEGGRQTHITVTFTDFDLGVGSTLYEIRARRVNASLTAGWNANLRFFKRRLTALQFKR